MALSKVLGIQHIDILLQYIAQVKLNRMKPLGEGCYESETTLLLHHWVQFFFDEMVSVSKTNELNSKCRLGLHDKQTFQST